MIALAALMLVVSGTLVAVILAGEGSAPEPPTLAEITATAEARATATAEAARPPTATPQPPSLIPPRLQARFDALPERLRAEVLDALREGSLSVEMIEQIIENYENRNENVRVGPVLAVEGSSLRMEVFTTGEEIVVRLNQATEITRKEDSIELDNLQPQELILVVFRPGTTTAASIEALGVVAPP